MLTALVFGLGLAAGVPPLRLVLLWAAWSQPVPLGMAVALITTLSWWRRRSQLVEPEEAIFLRTLAAELRAGQSLRLALLETARRSALDLREVVRTAATGRPLAEVGAALASRLEGGETISLALRVAAGTGGRASDIFDRLAVLATEEVGLRRERRALSAQARLSAAIVGGFPLLFLAWQLWRGSLAALFALGPLGIGVAAAGLALLLLGSAMVGLILRRAER
jgi:tight adherence protein B